MTSVFDAVANKLDAQDYIDPFRDNGTGWIEDTLDETIWSKQADIIDAVRDHRKVAVHACHSIGKSFLAARIAVWWISTHPLEQAFVVTSAPTAHQVRAILWREINRAHRKGGLVGRVNQTEWLIENQVIAYGRKPADHDEEGFQGIHDPYVLVILDEASGIPGNIWDGAIKITTGPGCRTLAIGNPDHEGSLFHQKCMAPDWHTIGVGAYDTPNFTGEPVPNGATLIDQLFIDDVEASYGTESPKYKSMVLGEFPSERSDGVIPHASLLTAMNNEIEPEDDDLLVFGIDVAGEGADDTVVAVRKGHKLVDLIPVRHDDNEATQEELIRLVEQWEPDYIGIDPIGVGDGHFAALKREFPKLKGRIVGVNFAEAASDKLRWINLRSEVHWYARENITGWDLSLLDDKRWLGVQDELRAAQYFENHRRNGAPIQVEAKVDIKRRLGRSPDHSDAILICFWKEAIRKPGRVAQPMSGSSPGGVQLPMRGTPGGTSNGVRLPMRGTPG